MFCKKCGKEISDDSKFCEGCGENLEVNSKVVNINETNPPKKEAINTEDNSDFIRCRSCGKRVAKSIKTCPHCGIYAPNQNFYILFVVYIIIVVSIVMYLLGFFR